MPLCCKSSVFMLIFFGQHSVGSTFFHFATMAVSIIDQRKSYNSVIALKASYPPTPIESALKICFSVFFIMPVILILKSKHKKLCVHPGSGNISTWWHHV